MSHGMTRRAFLTRLSRTAATGAGVLILQAGSARTYAANEKVNIACIGVGGMGAGNRRELMGLGANIVGLCDVDAGILQGALKDHPGARTWTDYRKMLQEQKEIDGVMVSTPDHHHAPASMMAIKLGKAVCCEKPLTHSVYEARALAEAARKHKVPTQHDHEGHASDGLRRAVEWVQSGVIGKVGEVHIFTDRPIWPQGIAKRPPSKPVPKGLDWDLWLGPAPYRDYHDHLHAFQWRGWWDFGTGALGDMGCHFFDVAFWALKLGPPSTVEAVQEGNSAETGPTGAIVTYQFPARGELPPVTVKWYEGSKLPQPPPEFDPDNAGRKFPRNGTLFCGDAGKLLVIDTSSPRLLPESRMKDFKPPAPFLPRSPGHKKEWLLAIKGGPMPGSHFPDYGSPLAETVLLGNLAIRTGRKIQWDSANLKATNAPEADQYIRREYRKGWEL